MSINFGSLLFPAQAGYAGQWVVVTAAHAPGDRRAVVKFTACSGEVLYFWAWRPSAGLCATFPANPGWELGSLITDYVA